jgi:phosphoenolpyruvate carboxykinase (GTP)
MAGRTMYVVPFSMGPIGSDKSHIGVQCTDSAYVAVSMRIMTRMGTAALDALGRGRRLRPVPALGRDAARRRRRGRPVAVQRRQQVHRPLPRDARDLVLRLGLRRQRAAGQEVLALRIASVMARDEGWMAEHMLILKLTSPDGRVKYVTGAFPARAARRTWRC